MNKQLAQGIAFIECWHSVRRSRPYGREGATASRARRRQLVRILYRSEWRLRLDPSTVFFDPGVFATTVLAPVSSWPAAVGRSRCRSIRRVRWARTCRIQLASRRVGLWL